MLRNQKLVMDALRRIEKGNFQQIHESTMMVTSCGGPALSLEMVESLTLNLSIMGYVDRDTDDITGNTIWKERQ